VIVILLIIAALSAYKLGQFAAVIEELQAPAWYLHPSAAKAYLPPPDYRAARGVYSFSVVPGGATDELELATAAQMDPVIAKHYRDIAILRLHPTRLNAAISVYASYRLGSSINWTSHKITVPKGELILTDGSVMVRARCGNRLTFIPPLPSVPNPPLPTLAGSPTPPDVPPIEPPDLVFEYGVPPLSVAPPPSTPVSVPPAASVPYWPPAKPAAPWCCSPAGFVPTAFIGGIGVPGRPHRPPEGPEPNPPPGLPEVPEPGTFVIFGSGLLAVLWTLRRMRLLAYFPGS